MQHGGLEKSEQAIRLAAAFAYLSVSEMDKVSIYAIHGNQVDEVISGMVGKDSYLNYINKLNEIDLIISRPFNPSIVMEIHCSL